MLVRLIFLLLVLINIISTDTFYGHWKNKLKTIKPKVKDKIIDKIQEKCKCELNRSLKSIINSKHVSFCVYIHFSFSFILNINLKV